MPSRCSSPGDPADAVGHTLPRCCRLLTARDFRRVYSRGDRIRGRLVTVVALRRRSEGFRLGLSVSKDNGPAVRRNKIKRLLREAFRLERQTMPGALDLVLIPKAETRRFVLAELRAELADLIARLHARPERSQKPRRGKGHTP